jgi:hypothetical protein
VSEERNNSVSPDCEGYDQETDLGFDEYLRTAREREEFAIPKMRVTQPSEVTTEMRAKLLQTMKQAHAERLIREGAVRCRSFGEFFRFMKKARSLNWKVIAERLNTTTDEVGRIEQNDLHPAYLSTEVHKVLIDLFCVPASYYVGVLKRLLIIQAEYAAASASVQFARNDDQAEQDSEKHLEALCANVSPAERELLDRFRALINALEDQVDSVEEGRQWGR